MCKVEWPLSCRNRRKSEEVVIHRLLGGGRYLLNQEPRLAMKRSGYKERHNLPRFIITQRLKLNTKFCPSQCVQRSKIAGHLISQWMLFVGNTHDIHEPRLGLQIMAQIIGHLRVTTQELFIPSFDP